MRFDFPKNYRSYVQCKSRARAVDALHVLLVSEPISKECVWQLSQYHYIEKVPGFIPYYGTFIFLHLCCLLINWYRLFSLLQILLSKCSSMEPNESEEMQADACASMIPQYKPLDIEDAPKVTFNSAISLVNRYRQVTKYILYSRRWVVLRLIDC